MHIYIYMYIYLYICQIFKNKARRNPCTGRLAGIPAEEGLQESLQRNACRNVIIKENNNSTNNNYHTNTKNFIIPVLLL